MTSMFVQRAGDKLDMIDKDPVTALFCVYNPTQSLYSLLEGIHVYKHALNDLPLAQLSEICRCIIKTEDFMPSVAYIRRLYLQKYKQLKTPDQAWQVFLRSWNNRSSNVLKFRSRVLQDVFNVLMHEPLAQMPMSDMRKRFIAVYRDVEKRLLAQNINTLPEVL